MLTQQSLPSVTQLPTKAAVYGSLVGLLNAKDQSFGEEVVNRAATSLQQAFNEVKVLEAKLLVRFVAELVNAHVVPSDSFIALMQQLLTLATGSVNQGFIDLLLYTTILTIPFVGAHLAKQCESEFNKLIQDIEDRLAARRHTMPSTLHPYGDQVVLDEFRYQPH